MSKRGGRGRQPEAATPEQPEPETQAEALDQAPEAETPEAPVDAAVPGTVVDAEATNAAQAEMSARLSAANAEPASRPLPPGYSRVRAVASCLFGGMPRFAGEPPFNMPTDEAERRRARGEVEIL